MAWVKFFDKFFFAATVREASGFNSVDGNKMVVF
jgi:hypothetical protein